MTTKAQAAANTAVAAPEKKAPAKKAAKPKAKKAASRKVGEYGMERSHDLPWTAKKVAVFKALRKLGEATATDAAKEAGLTAKDIRHYGYHAKAAGLVEVKADGGRYLFSLTAKGKKVDPAAELKAQEAKK